MKKTLLVIVFILPFLLNGRASAADYTSIAKGLNEYVGEELDKEKNPIIETLLDDEYSDENWKVDDVKLGTPFFEYNPEKSVQSLAVEYPLYIKNEMIGVLELYKNNSEWAVSVCGKDTPYIILDKIDMDKECPVFYVIGSSDCGDVVCVETKDKVYQLTDPTDAVSSSLQETFKAYSYEEKMTIIAECVESINSSDTELSNKTGVSEDDNSISKKSSANTTANTTEIKTNEIVPVAIILLLVVVVVIIIRIKNSRTRH